MRVTFYFFSFLLLALPAFAQDDAACADVDPGSVEAQICGDPVLESAQSALDAVWTTWREGINRDRISYLENEQAEWQVGLEDCLDEADAVACLQGRYEERVMVLSKPRIFKSETERDGVVYLISAEMTPISYDAVEMDKALSSYGFASGLAEKIAADFQVSTDQDCPLCSRERRVVLNKGFEGERLVMIERADFENFEGSDEVFHYSTLVFDQTTNEDIGLIGLFDPSTAPFAMDFLAKEVSAELDALNRSVAGNEDGATLYYWDGIEDTLAQQSVSDWNEAGLTPISEAGKITRFQYEADAYEFAPYASSQYFTQFEIDAHALLPFLRPEYRDEFL